MAREIDTLWKKLRSRFTSDCKAADHLRRRSHSYDKVVESVKLGYWPGSIYMKYEDPALSKLIYAWRDKPALVFPLRSLGGVVWGLQFERCGEGKSERGIYFFPGAETQGVFFFTDDFQWDTFKSSRECVIVEGCLDALSLSYYCKSVLSTIKAYTAESQIRALTRWCKRIHSCLDNDDVGNKATATLMKKTKDKVEVNRIFLPYKDSQELLELGKLENVVRTKLPVTTWKV